MSLAARTVVDADATLFAGTGSEDVAVTVAWLTMGLGPRYCAGTAKVAVTETMSPGSTVPMAQGNPPVHAPVAETNCSPAGVGSASTTPDAADGPAFWTLIV